MYKKNMGCVIFENVIILMVDSKEKKCFFVLYNKRIFFHKLWKDLTKCCFFFICDEENDSPEEYYYQILDLGEGLCLVIYTVRPFQRINFAEMVLCNSITEKVLCNSVIV